MECENTDDVAALRNKLVFVQNAHKQAVERMRLGMPSLTLAQSIVHDTNQAREVLHELVPDLIDALDQLERLMNKPSKRFFVSNNPYRFGEDELRVMSFSSSSLSRRLFDRWKFWLRKGK